MATLAESLGFDSVWVWDHVLLGSRRVFPILDSLTTLACIGARTTKIKLGTSVLLIALRNPLILSKTVSSIQFLTNGRLILGSASGWYEREFRATGIDFKRRGKIFEERFELVKRLVNESDVSYRSNEFDLDHVSLEPRAPQPMPMLIGGHSDTVLERAGRLADGWIAYYYTPEAFTSSWGKVIAGSNKRGKGLSSLRSVNIVPLSIAKTFGEGDKRAREFTTRYMDLPKNTPCTVESSIRGDIRDCIAQIKKYESAGVQDLVFIPCDYDLGQVELAGTEILPSFLN